MTKVELLAPAGDRSALIAAVQNGADAVYIGGRMFGARANASNFYGEELKFAVDYCHRRGVKLYMTVNTLVRDSEMPEVYEMVREAVEYGIDAAIVQDLGVAGMLREHFPDLALHASTQMTVMNRAGAEAAKSMGMVRVVPARECTARDIQSIAKAGLEVEVFVHGALCVGVSGQCLLSSMIGGRSGNRGRCAQPCRLPYTMDGKKKHFLSPADLCTLNDLDKIVAAGATSLKIEGRLKRAEYVAVVVKAYREALDRVLAGKPVDKLDTTELLKIFNRGGFTRGYALGKNDGGIMATARPNHWGVKVGDVLSVKNDKARVRLTAPLHKGDGLEARGKHGDNGILVQSIEGNLLGVPEGVKAGDELYRTTDTEQLQRAQESCAVENRAREVDAVFTARVGEPCVLELGGARAEGDIVQKAKGRPLDEAAVRKQISKLGDTVFVLKDLKCEMDADAFLPVSALNALRREAAQKLEEALMSAEVPQRIAEYKEAAFPFMRKPQTLYVLQSDDVQELIAAEEDADELYFAPHDYEKAALEKALKDLPEKAAVVLPTALDDAELAEALAAIGSRRIVCNNIAQVRENCIADVGLNVFNRMTAQRLCDMGAVRVTASAECTLNEAERLAKVMPVEFIVQGNVPLMVLRHCPIRAEAGLDEAGRENCRMCGRCGTTLTDRKGEKLELLPYHARTGCRMQVYSAQVFSALQEMPRISKAGFAAVRVIGTRQELMRVKAAAQSTSAKIDKRPQSFGHLYKGVE